MAAAMHDRLHPAFGHCLDLLCGPHITVPKVAKRLPKFGRADPSLCYCFSSSPGFNAEERSNFKNILIQNLLLGAKTLAAIAEESGSELLTDKKLTKVRPVNLFCPFRPCLLLCPPLTRFFLFSSLRPPSSSKISTPTPHLWTKIWSTRFVPLFASFALVCPSSHFFQPRSLLTACSTVTTI